MTKTKETHFHCGGKLKRIADLPSEMGDHPALQRQWECQKCKKIVGHHGVTTNYIYPKKSR